MYTRPCSLHGVVAISAGACRLSRIRQSIAAWHASTTDGRSTRSSGGYPMMASSGSTTSSAPAAAASSTRPSDAGEVAIDIAYGGIQLRERNGEVHSVMLG